MQPQRSRLLESSTSRAHLVPLPKETPRHTSMTARSAWFHRGCRKPPCRPTDCPIEQARGGRPACAGRLGGALVLLRARLGGVGRGAGPIAWRKGLIHYLRGELDPPFRGLRPGRRRMKGRAGGDGALLGSGWRPHLLAAWATQVPARGSGGCRPSTWRASSKGQPGPRQTAHTALAMLDPLFSTGIRRQRCALPTGAERPQTKRADDPADHPVQPNRGSPLHRGGVP